MNMGVSFEIQRIALHIAKSGEVIKMGVWAARSRYSVEPFD